MRRARAAERTVANARVGGTRRISALCEVDVLQQSVIGELMKRGLRAHVATAHG
jgi:hypothetical protein